VLPLTVPGTIGIALRSLFQPAAAFRVKPRWDPALWLWMLNFAKRCNTADMLQAAEALHAILSSSRTQYDELIAAEPFECEWEVRGMCFVLRTRPAFDHFSETAALLQERFGLAIERFEGDAVRQLEPALKPGLAGGWWFPNDAHLRPDRLMSSWRKILVSKGVQIVEQCDVQQFQNERGATHRVTTTQGEIEGDIFVVATGSWTPLLSRELGCSIPIQPGKGYSMTMPRPAICPAVPLIFEEHHVAVTPMQTGYRLGSTMEFAGYDTTLNRRRLDALREGARIYLQEPETKPIVEEWFGWRPMTYDSLPIIGRVPRLENVWVAAGHNMLGVSLSPGTGKLLAELVAGRTPSIDPQPYSLERFTGNRNGSHA
jgi:D-amino-acid dehydrogenase